MCVLLGLLFFISYLIGSIPTGYWFCKIFFKIDIMQHGSGNIGATNVARTLGSVYYFVLILIVDAVKAFALLYGVHAVLVMHGASSYLLQDSLILCAGALLVGNAHSIFLQFKGGKGVATMVGIAAYLISVQLLLIFLACWLVIMVITRQAFLASLGAMVLLTIAYGWFFYDHLFYFLVLACCWIIVRHKKNIEHFFKR